MSWSDLKFRVIGSRFSLPSSERGVAYLLRDNWDDFGYKTAFEFFLFTFDGDLIDVGALRIANLDGGKGSTELPGEFQVLKKPYVSLGTSAEYYEKLRSIPEDGYKHILKSLRDLAFSEPLWDASKHKEVVEKSLLRSTPNSVVEGQFRRIAQGGIIQTPYQFRFSTPTDENFGNSLRLGFNVDPESVIPSNIHVIIGRNGVGKSRLLHNLVKTVFADPTDVGNAGHMMDLTEGGGGKSFTGLVFVSFSAFDQREPLNKVEIDRSEIRYQRVGLVNSSGEPPRFGQALEEELCKSFAASTTEIISQGRTKTWCESVAKLDSDPGFADLEIKQVLDMEKFLNPEKYLNEFDPALSKPPRLREELFKAASEFFKDLSSGHKAVLLALTRLIECVNEKTLVLIDEPEGHLHPPLLSAFIRVLSDLMTARNGIAIIATHSPVILQEVPKACVWQLERYGTVSKASRPDRETFGENVGVLTSRVFGFEVTDSGFHRLIREIAERSSSYDEAISKLNGMLGSEAKAILMGMVELKNVD